MDSNKIFKYGDPHPENSELIFYQRKKGVNRFVTKERFSRYHEKTKQRSNRRYELLRESLLEIKKARYNSDPLFRARILENCKSSSKRRRSKISAYMKNYYAANRDKIIKQGSNRARERYKTDPKYRAVRNLRRRMSLAIKTHKTWKTSQFIIGCSKQEFMAYLESKFKAGMTWENHGLKGWHIDHIVPCSSFDLMDESQVKKCFHYSNLQPLWCHENIAKGSKTPLSTKEIQ